MYYFISRIKRNITRFISSDRTYFSVSTSQEQGYSFSYHVLMQGIRKKEEFHISVTHIRRNIHLQRDCSQLTGKYRQYPITSGILLAERKVVPSLIRHGERGATRESLFSLSHVFSFHL